MPDYLAPVFAQYPIPVASGEGVWLNTTDGRRILDLYGGHAVAALGYGHPLWTRALTEQARTLSFRPTRSRSMCGCARHSA
jgi:acetylornithine/N-succinyldiaminopimelate aminotransferase